MTALASAVQFRSRSRRKERAVAVVVGVLAAQVVFGVDVRQPAFDAGAQARDLTAAPIVLASAFGGLGAWLLLLASLERVTRRARGAWLAITSLALLVSLGAPLSGQGISGAGRVALVLMHLAVGAVVIVLLARSSPRALPLADSRRGL
jgi:hypothetical protein